MDDIRHRAKQYSPASMAFLGDAVYSEKVREMLVLEANTSARKLHSASVKYVRASFQAQAADAIEKLLTEDEAAVMKRGRNAAVGHGSIPKSSNPIEYHKATSLETLFGFLKLCGDNERIDELFGIIMRSIKDGAL